MTKLNDEPEIRQMARGLGLGRRRNIEQAIREFCIERVEKFIKLLGSAKDLGSLLEIISSGLGIRFEEVEDDCELQEIVKKYISQGELCFADLPRQLDDRTDAVLYRLNKIKEWKYIAVIDCREYKKLKSYFSKWHEVAHVLTMSPQESFQFRRTPAIKKEPKEQMVDRVAGDLAFYSPLFLPELLARVKIDGRLSFDSIDDLRRKICPEASREATIRAAVYRCPLPQLLVIARYGLKKQDERLMTSDQEELFPYSPDLSSLKLRAVDIAVNTVARESGLWIYRNMEVPPESIITEVYDMVTSNESFFKEEDLSLWKHSRGQLKEMPIQVEARKIGQRVFALINRV